MHYEPCTAAQYRIMVYLWETFDTSLGPHLPGPAHPTVAAGWAHRRLCALRSLG